MSDQDEVLNLECEHECCDLVRCHTCGELWWRLSPDAHSAWSDTSPRPRATHTESEPCACRRKPT